MKHRTFDTGATRDTEDGKLQFDKFLSPIVLKAYAEYMHKKRVIGGGLRQGDNWQKGIPMDVYMGSLSRHYMDIWLHQQGYGEETGEDFETALVAMMFNVMGMLHTVLSETVELPVFDEGSPHVMCAIDDVCGEENFECADIGCVECF